MNRATRLAAVTAFLALSSGHAEDGENAVAMVMRIEPADSGIAHVLRGGERIEAAFMMALYRGDELVVESPNATVQVKVFGGGDLVARADEPLRFESEAGERGMFSSMFGALSDKVFRNNQLSRRNLVTRSDGDGPQLALYAFDESGPPQNVVAGDRALLLRWNLDLDDVRYRIESADGTEAAAGEAEGDFAFVDGVRLVPGRAYRVRIAGDGGRFATGRLIAVEAAPPLDAPDAGLGAAGRALRLVQLAGLDGGAWKFEAIQGVLDLSPDDIDRATLIEELAAL